MNPLTSRLSWLFYRYQDGKCTPDERKELLELVADRKNQEELNQLLEVSVNQAESEIQVEINKADELFKLIINHKKNKKPTAIIRLMVKRILAAASVILVAGLGLYYTLSGNMPKETAQLQDPIKVANDALPGGNKAVLTLADGSQIILDSVKDGTITEQGNVKVIKLNNGQVAYNGGNVSGEIQYNTINTPKGGQYNIVLSDGTEVWLNAASSIHYPVAFTGSTRQVEISGEVYFEVAKDKSKPFIVKKFNDNATIQVLGTHFNVNAYADEVNMKITLLEGSVTVAKGNNQNMLKPGQQALLHQANDNNEEIKIVNDADVDEVMAWKNGKFDFGEKASIENIMRQLARWYNLEIEYKGKVSQQFWGTISRNVNASQVFKMLEATGGVKFKIEGNKVIVMP